MKTTQRLRAAPLLVALLLSIAPLAVQAEEKKGGVEVGILTCHSVPGTRVNLLIHSSVGLDCVFKTPNGDERYVGETGIGLGVDLNWDRVETLSFTVIAVSSDIRPGEHALAGKYIGGEASVTLGVGLGAAALIGGGEKNIALQPLAVQTSEGLGVAAGLGYLFLEAPPK